MRRRGRGLIPWLAAGVLVWASLGGCERSEEAGAAAEAVDAGAGTRGMADEGDAGSELLERLPDLCPLLPAEEASEILGAEAETPEGVPDEGRAGSLCRYIADRENRLGFELFMLPHDVWDPEAGTVEELVAVTERSRSSGPALTVWEDAPGLGGYYAEEEGATTAWIVTPYGWTAGMSDEADSQVYLRAYVRSPASASERLAALADLGGRILPRLQGG